MNIEKYIKQNAEALAEVTLARRKAGQPRAQPRHLPSQIGGYAKELGVGLKSTFGKTVTQLVMWEVLDRARQILKEGAAR